MNILEPAIGQMWSFSSRGEIQEIVLLTRFDDRNDHLWGILLFQSNESFNNLIGHEVGTDQPSVMASSKCWVRIA